MTVMNNEDPADPSVHEPRVTDAPAEIWLVYGELEHDDTHANLYRDGDVSWCQDKQYGSDVAYVRADITAELLDAVRAMLMQLTQGPILERDACVTHARRADRKSTRLNSSHH